MARAFLSVDAFIGWAHDPAARGFFSDLPSEYFEGVGMTLICPSFQDVNIAYNENLARLSVLYCTMRQEVTRNLLFVDTFHIQPSSVQ